MKTIYFVEDNQNLGLIWKLLFERNGFEVQVFESAEEILGKIDNLPTPHVVITDFNLPGANGVELLNQLSIRFPKILPIILTGDKEQVEMTNKIPRNLILIGKPIQFEAMREIITKNDPYQGDQLQNSL